MFHKEDVRFPAEGGIELSAWLFVPEHRAGLAPNIHSDLSSHQS